MGPPDGTAGTPLVPQGVMHVVAVLAIAALAVGLSIVTVVDTRALPHDTLDAAEVIEGLPFRSDDVHLAGASAGTEEPTASCFGPEHTLWYVMRPEVDVPLTTWLVPDRDGDGPLDVALSVWRSTGDEPPIEVGCIDERRSRAAEQLVLPAMAGATYHFGVSSPVPLSEDAGTVTFLVDEQEPAHDLFAFARWVDQTPYAALEVDASGARREPGETAPSCVDLEATTWYGISSPQDAVLSARLLPTAADAETGAADVAMALHTGESVERLLERACIDSAGAGGAEQLEFPLHEGEVYWLQVGAVLGVTGPGTYSLTIAGTQAIELAPIADTVFGAGPLAVAAEASSGLPVAIEVEGPCELRDGRVGVLGAGLCTITATQAGDDEWAPAQDVTTTVRIGRGSQSIALEPIDATRVGDLVAVQASTESGLPVTVRTSGPCEAQDGALVASGAGHCLLTVSQPGDDDWAPAEPVTTTVRIGRGRQAVDFAPLVPMAVGDAVALEASSGSDLPVSWAAEGACRVSDGMLNATSAGPCEVTASQPGDTDWAPAEPVTRSLRIARGEQAIELGDTPDTVFGADPTPITAEADSGLPVTLEVSGPCRVDDGALSATGAGSCVLTASQPGDADWNPAAPIIRRIAVAPAAQAVTLAPLPPLQAGDTAALSATSDSGLPVALEVVAGPCALDEGTLVSTGAGTCVLTATQPGDADWAPAEPLVRRITVAPADQAVTLAALPDLQVGDTTALDAASDSGLPVELEAHGPCLVVGDQLQALGAGPCEVTASQPGDTDWAPAEPVTRSLRIARGEQAIELEPIERRSLADGSVALAASSSAGLALDLEASGPCHIEGDRVVFDGADQCTITASHPGDADWVPAKTSVSFTIVEPWRLAEEALVERTARLGCGTVGSEDDPRPLANDALAGVRCDGPIDGVSALWLFAYPDTEALRAFAERRFDDGRGSLREDPRACVGGRSGVVDWEHGQLACWVPRGASRPVLHWTDERTDTYGVIRPRAGAERRLHDLWETVVGQVSADVDTSSTIDG